MKLNSIKHLSYLFIFLSCISGNRLNAQFSFSFDPNTSKYSKVENTSDFFGMTAGKINLNAFYDASNMDTTIWKLTTNSNDGKYSVIQNKVSYNGIDSGDIKIPMIYLVNAFTFDTLRFYDSLSSSFEQVLESAQYMDLDIIEWVKNRKYASKDSMNNFTNLNSFYGGINIYGSSNVARKDTMQNIAENWTFNKNVNVNGTLSIDTIENSSGNTVFKNNTGVYVFKSTNSSHSWIMDATAWGDARLVYSGNNNGIRITNTNTIFPNANNDGDLGKSTERYRTSYLGTSLDILGTSNKIKSYYDATHGIEVFSNSTGGVIFNNITASNSDMYFQLGGSSKIALSNYSSKNVFRPVASNVFLGDSGDRWGKSYFADNIDITWNTNVDAGFSRGVSDVDMTGIYLRSPNGTKYYITVDDSGIISASASPF